MPNSEDIHTYIQTLPLNLCEIYWTKYLELWLVRNHILIYSTTTDNLFIYSIADYFQTLSVVQTIWHQMVEESGNNELARSQKEAVTFQLLILSSKLPAGCKESQCPDWDLKPRPSKYKVGVLPGQQQCAVSQWHTISCLPPRNSCMKWYNMKYVRYCGLIITEVGTTDFTDTGTVRLSKCQLMQTIQNIINKFHKMHKPTFQIDFLIYIDNCYWRRHKLQNTHT